MSNSKYLMRYLTILNFLEKKSATFEEIEFHLENESNLYFGERLNIQKRTFQRDIKEISRLFDIEIVCDRRNKCYYRKKREEDSVYDNNSLRMLEAFQMLNTVQLKTDFGNFLIFETRKPLGMNNINGMLHALQNSFVIKFLHSSYWKESEIKSVEPLGVKEIQNRWYLIGKDLKVNHIKTFGLDRITDLEITKQKYKYPANFNLIDKFKDSLGIILGNEEDVPQEVILSYTAEQGKYVKSLPLHSSQKILVDTEGELRISLYIILTYDLEIEILKNGEAVEVIKPKTLRDSIKKRLKLALKNYENS